MKVDYVVAKRGKQNDVWPGRTAVNPVSAIKSATGRMFPHLIAPRAARYFADYTKTFVSLVTKPNSYLERTPEVILACSFNIIS